MNSNNLESSNYKQEQDSFLNINQQPFNELLTLIDFVDEKLNIALIEVKFSQDRELLINALLEHPECSDIQFEILDFSSPNLRFLRDELVTALQQIKIEPDKKLILLITGLEKSIGIVEEYPAVLTNLNFVRDDLRNSVCHPIFFFLPDYALTRLAKYAPDFWAWNRKVLSFNTSRQNLITKSDSIVYSYNDPRNLELPYKESRIELLLNLLDEYNSANEKQNKNNLSIISNICNQLGETYDALGGYKQAINYYQQSIEIAQQIDDQDGEARSLNNLGNAYDSLGEYSQAINYHQKSLAIAYRIGNSQEEANSLISLGNVHNSLGEHSQAIDYYQKSLAIQQQIGNLYGKAALLNNLGNAYHSLREYSRAIDYHQQSLAIKQQIGDRYGKGASLNNLGNVYHSLGEYSRAIDYLQQSLAITQQIGERYGEALSLSNLGKAYDSLGEHSQAIDYLRQSLAIQQQIGDRHGEADSWFNLGLAYKKLQQKSEAKTAYENAKDLYQALKLEENVDDCDNAIQSLGE